MRFELIIFHLFILLRGKFFTIKLFDNKNYTKYVYSHHLAFVVYLLHDEILIYITKMLLQYHFSNKNTTNFYIRIIFWFFNIFYTSRKIVHRKKQNISVVFLSIKNCSYNIALSIKYFLKKNYYCKKIKCVL
jgi:hypothetical protein